jgi:hypothetical protein
MSKDLFPENSPKKENSVLKLLKRIAKAIHQLFLCFAIIIGYAIIIGLVVFCLQTCSQNKETATDNAAIQQNTETFVYVTSFGKKYHTENCRYVSGGASPIEIEKAKKGYSPCLVCKPDKE